MSDDLLQEVINFKVFKLGNFKLKSGALSPIYIDLRDIVCSRKMVKSLAVAIHEKQEKEKIKVDVVCGVPDTASPLATAYSILYDVEKIAKRKEAKDHGCKKMIYGNFNVGDSCLIIEDIVSSGTSIIETAEALRREGLKVSECIVVVNRDQGGLENLRKAGIKLNYLFHIQDIFQAYCKTKHVEDDLIEQINCYFKDNTYLPVLKVSSSTKSFLERSDACTHQLGKELFKLMENKKTNLCVAVDTSSSKELLRLAKKLGPYICVLKTHADILEDFSQTFIEELKELSKQLNFFIMEDRKFAEIGNTAKKQFLRGPFKIQSWADMVTVHAIPGNYIVDALKDEKCGLVLIAEMSSEGAFTSDNYKEVVFQMAEKNTDCVIGFVAQKSYSKDNFINMCPGVNISSSGDALGQQYKSPEEAVANGADIIIVGRGICKADDVEEMAAQYRKRGYDAYLKRIS